MSSKKAEKTKVTELIITQDEDKVANQLELNKVWFLYLKTKKKKTTH